MSTSDATTERNVRKTKWEWEAMTRRSGLMAPATLTGLLAAACGAAPSSGGTAPAAETPVTLQLWGGGDQMAVYAEEYEQRTPGVRVETTKVGDYSVLAEKTLSAVAAGTPPNVAVLGQRHGITQLADGNALLDIGALLTKGERADVYPPYVEKFTYGGRLTALPFQVSVPVLYWNKEAFRAAGLDAEKPPATWEETVETGRRLQARRAQPDAGQWGLLLSSYAWYFYALLWQNGGEVVDKAGLPRFQEPPGVEAARWWQDLVHKHRIAPSTRPNTTKEFVAGGAGMLQGSQNIRAQLDRESALRYGIGFLPRHKRYAVGLGGNALGVFRAVGSTKGAAEAVSWRLVNWLTGTDMGARIVQETGYLPLRKSTVETPRLKTFFKEHPYAEVPVQQLAYLQPHSIQKADEVMYQELESGLQRLELDAAANPVALLDAVAARVRQLLGR